jgi:hypothetical protein
MSAWNKTQAIEWFTPRVGRAIALRQTGTPVRVRGVLRAVTEVDGCSAEFVTASLDTNTSGLRIEVSFHDDGVSVHALAGSPAEPTHEVSLATTIPYGRLELGEAQSGNPTARQDGDSPAAVYPYELIR